MLRKANRKSHKLSPLQTIVETLLNVLNSQIVMFFIFLPYIDFLLDYLIFTSVSKQGGGLLLVASNIFYQ